MHPPPRRATLVLVGGDGRMLGRLPPLTVETPWWHDAEPVVSATRGSHAIDVTVLRILRTELPVPHGGEVTYLAEVSGPTPPDLPLEAWPGPIDEDPLRMPWARPGGPAADLAWATARLEARGRRRAGPAVQVRSWNLSSLWRVPLGDGDEAWLKCVPPFFAHEGDLLRKLQGRRVPPLIGHGGHRILLAAVPGNDMHDADSATAKSMVSLLVDLQAEWLGRSDDLLAIGLPDFRSSALADAIVDVVDRTATELDDDQRVALDGFVAGLGDRFRAIEACGLPDTLVHGDFHPGNVRGSDDDTLVLLDWGDSGVGHPLLDQPAFLDRVPTGSAPAIAVHWSALWRSVVPGADPERAADLLAPVGAARQAVIFRRFLDRIESTERPYHRADPASWLGRVAGLVRARE